MGSGLNNITNYIRTAASSPGDLIAKIDPGKVQFMDGQVATQPLEGEALEVNQDNLLMFSQEVCDHQKILAGILKEIDQTGSYTQTREDGYKEVVTVDMASREKLFRLAAEFETIKAQIATDFSPIAEGTQDLQFSPIQDTEQHQRPSQIRRIAGDVATMAARFGTNMLLYQTDIVPSLIPVISEAAGTISGDIITNASFDPIRQITHAARKNVGALTSSAMDLGGIRDPNLRSGITTVVRTTVQQLRDQDPVTLGSTIKKAVVSTVASSLSNHPDVPAPMRSGLSSVATATIINPQANLADAFTQGALPSGTLIEPASPAQVLKHVVNRSARVVGNVASSKVLNSMRESLPAMPDFVEQHIMPGTYSAASNLVRDVIEDPLDTGKHIHHASQAMYNIVKPSSLITSVAKYGTNTIESGITEVGTDVVQNKLGLNPHNIYVRSALYNANSYARDMIDHLQNAAIVQINKIADPKPTIAPQNNQMSVQKDTELAATDAGNLKSPPIQTSKPQIGSPAFSREELMKPPDTKEE